MGCHQLKVNPDLLPLGGCQVGQGEDRSGQEHGAGQEWQAALRQVIATRPEVMGQCSMSPSPPSHTDDQ